MKYNTNLNKIPFSELSLFNSELKSIPNITLLTYGETDYPIDKNIKSELINSILQNNDKYSPSQGILELRKNIAKKENEKYNLNINEENILITNGSTEALFLALSSLINPNDEILLTTPTYPLYEEISTYLKAKIMYIKYNDDFEIDVNDLSKKISHKTKLIILNYPNNPTGKTLSNKTINELSKLLLKYKTLIILDNVYEDITFHKNDTLLNIVELHKQIIITNSLSKSKGLTGWRLGYLIGDKTLIQLATKLHELINLCIPKFMMTAMDYALSTPINIDYYKKNSSFIYNHLTKLKLNPIKPDGGFYVCFSIKEFNMDSISFCTLISKKYKLGLIPCSFFSLEGYVRISIASNYKTLQIGMKKLKNAINDLRKNR